MTSQKSAGTTHGPGPRAQLDGANRVGAGAGPAGAWPTTPHKRHALHSTALDVGKAWVARVTSKVYHGPTRVGGADAH